MCLTFHFQTVDTGSPHFLRLGVAHLSPATEYLVHFAMSYEWFCYDSSVRVSLCASAVSRGGIVGMHGNFPFNFPRDHQPVSQDDSYLAHPHWALCVWLFSNSHPVAACPFMETPTCLHLMQL